MLQILALYNYLLITKMTDLNYFVRKKIYVQALKKKFKDDVEFPLFHIKSSSCFIKEKEEGLDETCLFQTA